MDLLGKDGILKGLTNTLGDLKEDAQYTDKMIKIYYYLGIGLCVALFLTWRKYLQ